MSSIKSINRYLYRYRRYLIWGTVFIIISTFFSILPARLVRESFDLISTSITEIKLAENPASESDLREKFGTSILWYGVLILAMALLRGLFMFFMRQTIIVMSRHIEFDQKNDIFQHYQTLPLNFYRRNNTGDLMSRISEDVGRVRMYTGPAIMYGINMIVLFVMLIAYMFTINATLTLWVLLPLPILSVSIYLVNNMINKRSEAIQESISNLSTFVQEAFSGIRVAKSFVREEYSHQRFVKENNEFWKRSMRLIKVEAMFFPLIMGLVGMSTLLAVYIGGLEVAKGVITNGVIAEFVIYVNLLTWPVTSLGWTISIIQRAEASQRRINEFLHTKSDLSEGSNAKPEIKGSIKFENVSYLYDDSGTIALNSVDFEIHAGETVAIVGPTGSGKTTVANLLCRLMDPTSGKIYLDGIDLKEIDLVYLRSKIGYVPQDVFLFSDTISRNILFGADEESEETMLLAAKHAGLLENVQRFPKGFQTLLGERGITLSGGQKQRVSIARSLARNPGIIILDDCLSAVDTHTENEILQHLRDVTSDRTAVIISHRLSSVKLADRIVVLDDGVIVEQGTHESLYALGGVYRQLYEKQLEAGEVE